MNPIQLRAVRERQWEERKVTLLVVTVAMLIGIGLMSWM